MPANAPPGSRLPHRADVADRELIEVLSAATTWWAKQRTWQVSSSHTGGGVIAAFESAVADRVGPHSRALALPNATAALATALQILGVRPGTSVGVPAVDWTATRAVARGLGARSVPLPVEPDTGLLDAEQICRREELTESLTAVVAVHLHGLSCNVPALRRGLPRLPVIEDAAQAWGARYPDNAPIGSAADACAFSFGAAKSPSAGELGCLVTTTAPLHRAAIGLTQHPTRQLLTGIARPRRDQIMTRVAPAAALHGAYVLSVHAELIPALRRAAAMAANALRDAGLPVLTDPARHAPGVVAVRAAPSPVRAALSALSFPGRLMIRAVDRADIEIHPACVRNATLAERLPEITVITLGLGAPLPT